jgi:hypothetical protein
VPTNERGRAKAPRRGWWRVAACSVGLASTLLVRSAGSAAQEPPLPDRETFLREARVRLETDASRQLGYSYVETERRTSIDGQGRRREGRPTVRESYPGLPGEDRWDRVIQREGVLVPADALRRADEERQRKVERYAQALARQTPADRAKVERERQKDRRERADAVDDAFLVYDLTMLGRDRIEGHPTIVLSLTPRPDARPRTREGRMLKAFRGRAWVSESEFELARLDVEAIDTVSIGMGLLARIHKGTTASFTRRKVNDEAWLPARAQYEVSARILLLKRFRQGGVVEFSNYRKFTVATDADIRQPD